MGKKKKPRKEEAPKEEKPKEKPKRRKEKAAKFKLFEVGDEGRVKRLRPYCPRCGPGVFMADHGNRLACGKCGYTDFKKTE
ncbi:MAG: 30S ribosomal protein S27ae [Hadesarchaea archaeon]|nr:30S ribosomal protein S27ae [Hadesarchaea archaeon]